MRPVVLRALSVVLAGAGVSSQTAELPPEVVVHAVGVVDVESGRVLPDRDIVVRGTSIDRVTAAGAVASRRLTLICATPGRE